jgi:hypothetical protein
MLNTIITLRDELHKATEGPFLGAFLRRHSRVQVSDDGFRLTADQSEDRDALRFMRTDVRSVCLTSQFLW